MKILDRYILSTYLKTFISVFLILMLIFVLQTIWLFIKELAGKDLDLIVVLKFLLYYSPKLIPLVLPLTILLASIMVFGNFAENYEFAAMKSTGISLQRAMTGLGIFIGILGITTFFFSNSVIPWGEYNSYNLRNNIKKLKPAMAIAEGQFNDVGNFNIKVEEKSGLNGKDLKGVVIHTKSSTSRGNKNHRTIISKTGELIGNDKSSVLKLILHDGYFYDDTPPKDFKEREKNPLVKSAFKKYTFNIDLSNENSQDLDEKNVSDKYSMLNVSDLSYTIDSLTVESKKEYDDFSENLHKRSQIITLDNGLKPKDSVFNGDILSLYDARKNMQLIDLALNTTNSTRQIITSKEKFLKKKQTNYNKHIVALHEKFALGFACIILFFVGAPLGALIRKGGIGLPMVIAILLFLTYHFIGIFAKNSANDGSVNPILAPWLSTIIMFPLGVFLTRRATADRGLFEFDHIIEPIKKVFKIKSTLETDADTNTEENLVKEENINEVKSIFSNYNFHSKTALIFYITGLILIVLFFVFKNNKLPNFASAAVQLSVVSFVMLLIYYIKSFLNMNALYVLIDEKTNSKNPLTLLLGYLFYPLTYYLRRNKINEDFSNTLK